MRKKAELQEQHSGDSEVGVCLRNHMTCHMTSHSNIAGARLRRGQWFKHIERVGL